MKESGIRKLKDILNEYEDYKEKKFGRRNYKWICYGKENPRISADRAECNGVNDCLFEDESRAVIISKGYNFIKWLVDNDKIDLDKKPTRNKYRLQQYKTELGGYGKIDEYSELLMLLSIQDSPIDFLISIIKK